MTPTPQFRSRMAYKWPLLRPGWRSGKFTIGAMQSSVCGCRGVLSLACFFTSTGGLFGAENTSIGANPEDPRMILGVCVGAWVLLALIVLWFARPSLGSWRAARKAKPNSDEQPVR